MVSIHLVPAPSLMDSEHKLSEFQGDWGHLGLTPQPLSIPEPEVYPQLSLHSTLISKISRSLYQPRHPAHFLSPSWPSTSPAAALLARTTPTANEVKGKTKLIRSELRKYEGPNFLSTLYRKIRATWGAGAGPFDVCLPASTKQKDRRRLHLLQANSHRQVSNHAWNTAREEKQRKEAKKEERDEGCWESFKDDETLQN